MEKINNVFDRRVDIVCDNYSSVFTKDDVLNLISGLRADVLVEAATLTPVNTISEMDFQEFSSDVSKRLERALCDGSIEVYDVNSAEYSIDYHNTIVLENIDVHTENITDELANILLDEFQIKFGKLLTTGTE